MTTEPSTDEQLLIEADSILSLIRYRERGGLSQQTVRDVDDLLSKLRPRTDEIARHRWSS
jgi:hypothetical protein